MHLHIIESSDLAEPTLAARWMVVPVSGAKSEADLLLEDFVETDGIVEQFKCHLR